MRRSFLVITALTVTVAVSACGKKQQPPLYLPPEYLPTYRL